MSGEWTWYDLERWEHFSFLFTVDKAVVILHRDEGRELVCDCVIWKSSHVRVLLRQYNYKNIVLCMAWTAGQRYDISIGIPQK
jgi:hypothetical protein